MSAGIKAVVVDPTLNTCQEVQFSDANSLWDAIDTASEANRTYHESIAPNKPQKLHFRYKIAEGQTDITDKVLKELKNTIKKIWGKKLLDEQIILSSFNKAGVKHYDIVVAGYHVLSCREAQFAAKVLKSKVKQWLVIDGTVYNAHAKWLIQHNYAPQTGASVKIPANPVAQNQRVFNINSLVTWIAGTEALPNKSDRPFVPHSDFNEADPSQNAPAHPSLGTATDEVPEDECPEDHLELNQQDQVVSKNEAKAVKKAAKTAAKVEKKEAIKAALVGKKEAKAAKKAEKTEKKEEKEDSEKRAIKKSKAGHLKTALFGKAKKRGQEDGKLDDLEEVIH